jgi:cytochrome c556
MSQFRSHAAALALLLALGAAPAAAADEPLTAEQAVQARQTAMKEDGRALRHADELTGEDAIKVLTLIEANYERLPSLFPEDSITGKSIAKPIIWDRFDEFTAIFDKGAAAAADGIAAIEAGDQGEYLASLKRIGATCTECHRTFREKRE